MFCDADTDTSVLISRSRYSNSRKCWCKGEVKELIVAAHGSTTQQVRVEYHDTGGELGRKPKLREKISSFDSDSLRRPTALESSAVQRPVAAMDATVHMAVPPSPMSAYAHSFEEARRRALAHNARPDPAAALMHGMAPWQQVLEQGMSLPPPPSPLGSIETSMHRDLLSMPRPQQYQQPWAHSGQSVGVASHHWPQHSTQPYQTDAATAWQRDP
jgi:hypothetical protein